MSTRMKIIGYYVVRDGSQIGWFRTKSEAAKYARVNGGLVRPEFQ